MIMYFMMIIQVWDYIMYDSKNSSGFQLIYRFFRGQESHQYLLIPPKYSSDDNTTLLVGSGEVFVDIGIYCNDNESLDSSYIYYRIDHKDQLNYYQTLDTKVVYYFINKP